MHVPSVHTAVVELIHGDACAPNRVRGERERTRTPFVRMHALKGTRSSKTFGKDITFVQHGIACFNVALLARCVQPVSGQREQHREEQHLESAVHGT